MRFFGNKKGQVRIVEALIVCFLLSTVVYSTTYIAHMSGLVQTSNRQESLKNVMQVLSDPNVIRRIAEGDEYTEAELNTLIRSILPPDTAYNVLLSSAITGDVLWNCSSSFDSYSVAVSGRHTVTISMPISEVKYGKIDTMLVIDRSGSMGWEDDNGDVKIELAREAAKLFVEQLNMSQDRVGLASFSTEATLDSQLINDAEEINGKIDSLSADGYTNIGGGVLRSNEEFTGNGRSEAFWVIILLSDGVPNYYYDEEGDPIRDDDGDLARQYAIDQANLAKNLAGKGVKIYTIGLGAADYLDEDLLKEMASHETRYYNAPNAEDLADIYLAIAADILFQVRYDIIEVHLTLYGAT